LFQLQKLVLHGNDELRGISQTINTMQALKELDIGQCGLRDLPEELWSLENVSELSR